MSRPLLEELRTAARQLTPDDIAQLMREMLEDLLERMRADATTVISGEDLELIEALLAETYALAQNAHESPPWPPPGVTVQLPVARLATPPLLTGGIWDPDLPLRREDLYDDAGRA